MVIPLFQNTLAIAMATLDGIIANLPSEQINGVACLTS
jgi:hypothetical protein